MDAARIVAPPVDLESIDQRIFFYGLSWRQFESLLALRGERSVPRFTYLEGTLEIMSPSINHELLKKRLARLVEAWSEETGIDLAGAGSWTVKKRKAERAAEPDECYVLLPRDLSAIAAPDIAIEVMWTRGGLDRLEVWRKLGAREVWMWKKGKLMFHLLRGERYQPAARSELLPALDPELIERFMTAEYTQPGAVRALRSTLREG